MKIDLTHSILTFLSRRQPGTPPSECDGVVIAVRWETMPDDAQPGEETTNGKVTLLPFDCPKCGMRIVQAHGGIGKPSIRNEYAIPPKQSPVPAKAPANGRPRTKSSGQTARHGRH